MGQNDETRKAPCLERLCISSSGCDSLPILHGLGYNKTLMKKTLPSLKLILGPLRYQFLPHDAWGEGALARLRSHVDCLPFRGRPQRTVHLLEMELTRDDLRQLRQQALPERLQALLPPGSPAEGWRMHRDETGLLSWCHPDTPQAFGTFHSWPGDSPCTFDLPWQLMLEDIVRRGGAILHGGLALWQGRGYIFTAPPGGGKTTALSRIPAPWQVLADDAALLWPARGGYWASPLPTWSVLLARSGNPPGIERWELGRRVPVAGLFFLDKAASDALHPLPALQSAQRLYRALCEHPQVLGNRAPFRKSLFHAACTLAQILPLWELHLTRHGPFWEVLQPILPPDEESSGNTRMDHE